MPIKWSAFKVSEAADLVENLVGQAVPYLNAARIVAREARSIENLPQYVDQHLACIIGEIDRAIDGGRIGGGGTIRDGIQTLRKSIPQEALETERARQQPAPTPKMF